MNSADLYEYLKYLKKSNSLPDVLVVRDNQNGINSGAVCKLLNIPFVIFPDIRVFFQDDLKSFYEEIRDYLLSIYQYYEKGKCLIVSPVHTLKLPIPKKKFLKRFKIEFADSLNINKLRETLNLWGYQSVDIVTQKGEFLFNKENIDIFPPNSENPYRLKLSDSDVESIHKFDVDSQKRFGDELEEIEIAPFLFSINRDEFSILKSRVENGSFNGSFYKDLESFGLWVLDDFGEYLYQNSKLLFTEDLSDELEDIYSFGDSLKFIKPHQNFLKLPKAKEYREIQVNDINKLIDNHRNKNIRVLAENKRVAEKSSIKNLSAVKFIYSSGVINLMGKDEMILSINSKINRRFPNKTTIILDELNIGEYVVHQDHGIGIFRGIVNKKVLGVIKDFVEIEYQQENRLYIPIESLETIDRYIADSGSIPTLDRLGKSNFRNLKAKLKKRLFETASEIVNRSAQRVLERGIKINCDERSLKKFLSQAGFEHTRDQLEAIEDITQELKSGQVMDRLLSADVGFGKTEVAMSAIFSVVQSGYQSMIIVPTTLLSNQHYKTLKSRFLNWNIKIEKVDGTVPAKRKKEIFKLLESGDIDVVVGTHTLLKAKFKKLALVVVDEEHKFGVKQKEALKEITINVHFLSMSATPIPRSLNMALSKIKSFSEILTPPIKRAKVRTFLRSFDAQVIKEAILRELRRGGQIFYIYNSISTIEEKAEEIKSILKDLRVLTLHSKITPSKIEKEMLNFEAKKYDLLLSTTIVESGLDMPNVNTIIIDGADNFGIADLHQLRGRVGRGGKEGYCYLIVEDVKSLTEKAKRRVSAIEKNSELGSGRVLAREDLKIRGGGNILGKAQSGHIKQIGYSLYLKMLESSIKELTETKKIQESRDLDINLQIDAYLSRDLISEDRLRLELYRRLAKASSVDEVFEIKEEIIDRFGSLDKTSSQYIELILIKVLSINKNISKIHSYRDKIFIEFYEEDKKVVLKANSKDSDDILNEIMNFLRKN